MSIAHISSCYSLFIPQIYIRPYTHQYTYTQCVSPYIGDGSLCVLDSDADNYPDLALRTCKDTDTQTYCRADTCPNAPNPNQTDITPCRGNITGILPALLW